MKRIYRSTAAIALGWLIGSCGGGDGIVGPPPPPTTATVMMSADSSSLVPAATFQLTATAKSAAGEALSRNFAWTTSDTAKVTVSSNGLVAGVAPGTATITAAVDGKSASAKITVLDGGVISASGATLLVESGAVQIVVPADAVASQTNVTVVASTSYAADPKVVKGTAFDFGPSPLEFKKTVSLKIKYDATKLPAGTEQGALKIHLSTSSGWQALPSSVDTIAKIVSAEISHFSTYAVIIPAAVSAIVIRGPPDTSVANGASSLQVGASEQLTATLTDASGQILTDRVVTWASSHPDVATVTAGGLVAALTAGSSSISASAGGVTVSIALTVVPIPVASVGVTLAASSVIAGATTHATAVTRAANGDVLSGRSVAWTSSNVTVATVSADGTVSAISPGTADITATSEGKSGTASITVAAIPVASVNVTLTSNSITAVGTAQATATTLDGNGRVLTGRGVTWSSSAPGVVTVSITGVVTAVSVGTANIIATSEGKSGSAAITVTPAPVAFIAVSPQNATLVTGGSQLLTATVEDAHHSVLTGRVVDWSTDAPGVATVSANGLVSTVSPGVATIAAVSETKIATATITVTPVPVASVSVSLAAPSVVAGQGTQATATTLDAGGNQLTGRIVAWTSDNQAVATVSSSGLVTSVAAGTAHIIATSETKTGQANLTVTPVPVATVSVSPANPSVIVGSTVQLAATTKDASGNTLTGRVVAWSSTDIAIASVDLNGVVTAHAIGSATINAISEGKTGSSTITVIAVPVASVTVSLSPSSITAVGTSQATAITLDLNGGVLTGRVVTWTSGNTAVATVSAQGVVTAVAVGTVSITGTSEGKTGSASITVTQAPVATVTVSPPSATVFQGASDQLTVVLEDAHHNVLTRPVSWSSSNPSVATVSTSGLVTAAAGTMGTTTITATSEGQTGTSSITVSQVPVASISVSLSPSTVTVGQNAQASAILRDAGGIVLTGRIVTWTSDNTAVATVSNSGLVTALAEGSAHITAASGGQAGSATLTATPIPVASVSVSLAASPIQIGQTTQATATTRDANNNVLTGRVIVWSSDNTGVATVSGTGLVAAIAAGSANIIATSEGNSGSASLSVVPVPVGSLTLSAPTTPVILGQIQQLTAIPKDAGGNPLTGRTVNWVSSNPAVLALSAASSVSTSSGATVTVTAAGLGTAIITASSESAPSAATPVITVNPIPVATVTVSPASASLALGINSTQQLTATLRDANNNVLTGRLVTWSSSNPSAATVDGSGFVTAVGGGNTTITATSETKTGTASITVTVPVASVTVSPSSATLTVGLTHQLTATLKDINNNTLTGRVVTWSSSDPALASVTSSGLVTAVAAGTAVITATSEGKSGTSSITVTPIPVASVSVSLSATTIQVGQTTQATATTFDASNNILTGRVVTWSSGNTAVATVSSAGLVTAVAAGTTTIIATSEGKSGNASIAVIPVPVGSVTVSPATATVIGGATQQLSAETRDANNVVVTDRVVTWSSSNTAVATVNGAGLVTAVSVGGTTITATSEGKNGTSSITVIPVPVASVTVSLSPNSITAVGTSQATATTLDGNGGALNGRVVTWTSGNTSVATVSAQGLVTAVAVGTVSITATSEGKSGSATLTVTQAPVASVTVTPSNATVVQGGAEQLSVTLKDAHDNVLTRPVTWSSSSDAIATVSSSGLVAAMSPGTATITATSESQSGTALVTVSPIPVASVGVTLTSSTITDAQTTQATAIVRDANGNVLTGRIISWTSDNTSVAAVSVSGLVTPVAAGSAQIRATSGGQTGNATLTVIPAVATVVVSPSPANVVIATNVQLAADTRDANNNVLTGRTVTWSSDAPSTASVSASGLVTAVALGTATITATSEGKTGTSSITVVPVPVALVTVSLASTSITVGQATQATASTRDASGTILTGRSVTWSSGNPALATVSGIGVVTAIGVGSVQVIAMSEGKTGSATLTVNPAPVANLTLSLPATPMVVGGTQVLTALPKDVGGNTLSGRTVNWVSSNIAVLTVSAASSVSTVSGATVTVTSVGTGTATITATSESAPAATTPAITVNPVPVATVTVSLAPTSITAVGISQATATTLDGNGNTLTGRVVTWSSSNNAVATVDAQGVVTAVAAGTASVTATSEGKMGSATITVTQAPVATVTVSLAASSINALQTTQATATLLDSQGRILTGRTIDWSSSNPAIATVSQTTGFVTAVSVGSANIIATSEGKSGGVTLTVTPAPVATVSVNPPAASLVLGITPTQQLTVVLRDANGSALTGRTVTWTSSDNATATVDANGLVTAQAAGTSTITATSEGKSGTSSIAVSLAPVATLTISAPTTPMIVGSTQQLTATTKDASGNVLTGRTITWVSSNTAVLTVSASGTPATVTAVGVGTATITATSESVSSSPTPTITVNPIPVASVTVGLTPTSITAVGTSQATATTLDANGNTLTGRIVTWSSNNTAVATVSPLGLVTGVAVGTASITATSEGNSGSATVTVTPAPVATVTVSLAASSINAVQTTQATAALLDAQGRVLTGRTVAWSSDNSGVATISSTTGLISAAGTGTANIIATSEGKTGSAPLTVTPAPVATVTVSAPTTPMILGDAQQLTAIAKDANGSPLAGRTISWTSSNTAVLTVSPNGSPATVTAVGVGTATITAASESVSSSPTPTITVNPIPVATVVLSVPTTPIVVGGTQVLTATPKDGGGNTLSGRTVNWISSNTAILSLSVASSVSTSSGAVVTVTAAGVGTATVTATSESAPSATTPSITVTPVPVATVTVSPATASLVLGITSTQQLTAVTKDANGNVLAGRTVTWSSSNTSAAGVDATGLVTAVGAGSATITAASEGQTGTSSVTVTLAPVNTVTVSPATADLVLGITPTQQLTATLRDAANNVLTGRLVTWSSSNTAVATVDANGLVTAVAAGGAVTITATSETKTGTSSITVTLAPVTTVTVTPSSASLVLGITPTQQLTAVTKDANGTVLTGRTVTWSSSNSAVATVDGSGLVTAVAAGGPVTITATSETKTGASSITVTLAPVNTVTVTPASASLVLGIAPTQQLTAVTKDANGTVLTGRTVTWSSSNSAVATVDGSGLVTAVAAGGSVTITATSETKTGTSSITVTLAPVNTVTVTPSSASLVLGITPTQQLTATLRDAANNVLTGRLVTWTSSNTAVATVDANGLVTAVAAGGPVTITATSETKTGTSSITVTLAPVNTVTVTPSSASLVLGITPTQQLTAVTKDANGNVLTGRLVTWTSSNTAVATVDANGLVTAVAVGGPVTITATSETKTSTSSITVTLAPVNTVTVSPATASLVLGITPTQQLAATLTDINGNVLTGRTVTWTSSNSAVVTVSPTGLVTAVAAGGPVTITATSETKTGTSSITVTLAPVNTVTVTPSSASLVLGIMPTQQLTAVTKDANGTVLTGRTVTWSSSNSAVATVDANGLVTAVGAGATTITATSETKTGTSSITVTLAPVNTVTVSPATAGLVLGITPTQQLAATLRDAANNVLTGRAVTWSSSNSAVATVDGNGLVTAVAAGGPVTITATSETKTGTSSITVTLAPVNTVTVSPATASLVLGIMPTQQLTAVTKDANGTVLTGRTVTWSSNNSAVATVDANGLVTAVGAGATTITATSETKTGTSSITVTLAPVNTVTVTPGTASLVLGITPSQQLTAVTKDANGTVLTGRLVTWSSSNTAVATVDANGLVTAVGAGGPVTITATSETKTGMSSITVALAPVNTVTVSPATASLVLGIAPTQQLIAVTKDANGNALTGRLVTWSSSNTAAASVDGNGLVTAVGAGATTITATSETKTGASSVTVTLAPVNTVTVTPSSASLVLGITPTQQLTATLRDAANNVLTGRVVTWSSSNTAVATVDANGLVTAVAAGGPVTITATSETKTGTSSVTVTLAPVNTVTVTPATASLVLGITPTQQLTAVTKDANGNVLTGRLVTWSSSNTAAATVDANGLVTAVAAGGPVTITATSETKTGTSSITVTLAPVSTVTVTPATASLVLGIAPTQQLTAVTKDANGNVVTGRAVTWSSSNTAAANVDATGLVTAVGVGSTTITAASEGQTGTSSITVTLAPVNTVTVTPASASLVLGITPTQQLIAVTKDANGNVLTGRLVTWSSSNTAAATVDGSGLVTAVGAGGTTITATSETKTGTSSITVTLAPVNTVTVSPSSASLVLGITPTQQLAAVTKDANGNVLTGRLVTWSSSNTAAATVDANGLVTAVGAGGATITATSETKAGTSSITVTLAPVNTVTVTPSSASLVLGITPTQQFTAVTKDANGNVLTGRLVTWSSSNTAVATVDANGLVTAVAAGGPVTITATSETKTGTSSVTVTLAPVNTVTVSPATASLVLAITPTQQLTAVTKDANGNALTGRLVTWSSSNTAVATVDANGLVTAVAAGGPVTITATSETKTGTSSITVTLAPVNTVTVTPSSASLVLGITPTQQLTATLRDAANNVLTGRLVTWSSSNTAAATVDANGLVTAVGTGGATITATSETKTGTSSITVALAPVNTVTVTPSSASLVLGITPTQQLTAVTKDANGNVLTGRVVSWASSNSAVATVDANGLVTAVAAGGPVTITATSETKTGTSSITVTLAPVNTVTVTPSSASLVLGITPSQQLTATLRDAANNVLTGRLVTWSSSNTAAATVDANGLVTAVGAGATTITATSETKTGTSSVTVTLAPVNTVTVTPSSASLVLGITPTQQLTAVTKDANGNVLTGRLVTWSSSNTAAATVGTNGFVTAVGVGVTNITATSETKTGTSSITVALAPVNSVTVSPATASLVLGITPTQQLAAVTKDANGNVLTGRVVTWSSSNTAVATVDANGLVTAVAAGGPVTITATSETKTGTSSITVALAPVNTVTVSPATASLVLGITPTQQLTATLRDAANNVLTGRVVTWSSSNTAVATVDANGLVTAVAAGGPVTITATSETKTGTSSVTVTLAPVNTVTVTPATASLVLGITPTQQLTAVTKDANGNVVTGRVVTWSSSNTAVATVDANGLVTAVAAGGPVTITATSETKTGTSSITVTLAPVNTVTVTPVAASLVLGITPTQQLTAVTKDANGNVVTGRLVTWASSNSAVATVDGNGLVTAVAAGGPVTITATSETKTGTSSVTVALAPVNTVTVTPATASLVLGITPTQQLTAVTKDANGTVLTGRTVTWSSSNSAVASVDGNGLVTAVAAGGPVTITATSETKTGTSSITVTGSGTTATLLHHSTNNPRYFENAAGQIVYLTGSHTWSNLQDNGTVDPPPAFNYTAYLDFLTAHNHNFFRLWAWEQSKWTAEIAADYWITPGPFKRVGPGTALDGKPKFDLNQFDQAYFDRLRSRVQDAASRGIYVSIMLFDGWSVGTKGSHTLNNPWQGHPFNAANNINGIDGDTDGDGFGFETQTLTNAAVTAYQEAYVHKVIDAVSDLDNVLYEIDNEGEPSSKDWQYHMIQVVRDYETTKGRLHPIGMTPMWPNGVDADLVASNADWIAITGDLEAPATANGSKVMISDTDHLCGICGSVSWIWKAFGKGYNPLLMDGYDGAAIGMGAINYDKNDPIWELLRKNMGYARSYALQMDLATARPHGDKVLLINSVFVPTGYCMAIPGSQYLVFIPGGGNVTLDLTEVTGTLSVEWFNPATGIKTPGGTVTGGPSKTLNAPFSGDAVLFLH